MILSCLKKKYQDYRDQHEARKFNNTIMKLKAPYHLAPEAHSMHSSAYMYHVERDISGLDNWGRMIGLRWNCWHGRLL
jgi:hypothetical protein